MTVRSPGTGLQAGLVISIWVSPVWAGGKLRHAEITSTSPPPGAKFDIWLRACLSGNWIGTTSPGAHKVNLHFCTCGLIGMCLSALSACVQGYSRPRASISAANAL